MKEMITVERKKLEELQRVMEVGYVTLAAERTLEEILNPTMTKADWQRVMDEKFLVQASSGMFYIPVNESATHLELAQKKVVREKGLRQPHFKGHPHPEGKVLVVVYVNYNNYIPERLYADNVIWEKVTEYIVL